MQCLAQQDRLPLLGSVLVSITPSGAVHRRSAVSDAQPGKRAARHRPVPGPVPGCSSNRWAAVPCTGEAVSVGNRKEIAGVAYLKSSCVAVGSSPPVTVGPGLASDPPRLAWCPSGHLRSFSYNGDGCRNATGVMPNGFSARAPCGARPEAVQASDQLPWPALGSKRRGARGDTLKE